MIQFLILSLAVWRLCALFLYDDLPFDLMAKFRDRIGVIYHPTTHERVATTQLARLFICIYCLSIWVALPFAVYFYQENFFIYWLGLSGAAILLDNWNNK